MLLVPPSPSTPLINADTGATGNFMSIDDMSYLVDVRRAEQPIAVQLPNGAHIWSTHTALLDIPSLPLPARTAHIFPDLTSSSLLSIGLLCDHGCTTTYTNTQVTIQDNTGKRILTGARSPITKLWMVPIVAPDVTTSTLLHRANTVIHSQTQAEFVRWHHAALGSPAIPTLLIALRKGFIVIPGLTAKTVRRNLPHTIATSKGHLDQTRQGLRSTSKKTKAAKRAARLPARCGRCRSEY